MDPQQRAVPRAVSALALERKYEWKNLPSTLSSCSVLSTLLNVMGDIICNCSSLEMGRLSRINTLNLFEIVQIHQGG